MSYAKDKQEFAQAFAAECGDVPELRAILPGLFRLANKHQSLMVEWCNGDKVKQFSSWDAWEEWREKETEKVRASISALFAPFGIKVKFSGDPRGFTVKCHFPKTGAYNSWGGLSEGYGVPTRDDI